MQGNEVDIYFVNFPRAPNDFIIVPLNMFQFDYKWDQPFALISESDSEP